MVSSRSLATLELVVLERVVEGIAGTLWPPRDLAKRDQSQCDRLDLVVCHLRVDQSVCSHVARRVALERTFHDSSHGRRRPAEIPVVEGHGRHVQPRDHVLWRPIPLEISLARDLGCSESRSRGRRLGQTRHVARHESREEVALEYHEEEHHEPRDSPGYL